MLLYKSLRSSILLLALALASCVQFKTAALYDGAEQAAPQERPRKLSLAVEPVIYEDDMSTVWFMENPDCVKGKASSGVVYKGDKALEISWNRGAEGCIWSGLGFGWDDWAGKDISGVLDYAAIEMYVRSVKGKMYSLPIVLTFEDYSGGQSYSYTGNKYFERPFIDEQWQKVVVPLSTFDIKKDGLDATNVKQLMMELQQSGSIYLDEIHLVYFEEEPQEPWLAEEALPDPLALPIQLFDDAFINNNGWGLMKDNCQDIGITASERSTGAGSIHARWDNDAGDCHLLAFGVSWNKWHPVDITPVVPTASLQFDIRTASGAFSELPIQAVLQDYGRVPAKTQLTGKYVTGGRFVPEWRAVSIPLSDFRGQADLTNVRDLVFQLEGKGDIYIDNIRLVSEKGP